MPVTSAGKTENLQRRFGERHSGDLPMTIHCPGTSNAVISLPGTHLRFNSDAPSNLDRRGQRGELTFLAAKGQVKENRESAWRYSLGRVDTTMVPRHICWGRIVKTVPVLS